MPATPVRARQHPAAVAHPDPSHLAAAVPATPVRARQHPAAAAHPDPSHLAAAVPATPDRARQHPAAAAHPGPSHPAETAHGSDHRAPASPAAGPRDLRATTQVGLRLHDPGASHLKAASPTVLVASRRRPPTAGAAAAPRPVVTRAPDPSPDHCRDAQSKQNRAAGIASNRASLIGLPHPSHTP